MASAPNITARNPGGEHAGEDHGSGLGNRDNGDGQVRVGDHAVDHCPISQDVIVLTRKRDGSPLFNQKYGKFEFRAKLPTGKGVWPALWMLPQEEKYGGWPSSGEIDVLEAKGQEPTKVLGTLHFGSRWPANSTGR